MNDFDTFPCDHEDPNGGADHCPGCGEAVCEDCAGWVQGPLGPQLVCFECDDGGE